MKNIGTLTILVWATMESLLSSHSSTPKLECVNQGPQVARPSSRQREGEMSKQTWFRAF